MSTGVPTWSRDATTGRLIRSSTSISPSSTETQNTSNAESNQNILNESIRMEPLIRLRHDLDQLSDQEFNKFKLKWLSMIDNNRNVISSHIYHYFHQQKSNKNETYKLEKVQNTINNIIKFRQKTSPSSSLIPIIHTDDIDMEDKDDIMSIKELTLEPSVSAQPPLKSRSVSRTFSGVSFDINSGKRVKEKQKKKKLALNNLPKVIISDIASYLHLGNYMKFEQVCRSIYISCNSPSTLQEVQLLVKHQDNPQLYYYFDYDYNIRTKYPLIQSFECSIPYFNIYLDVHKHDMNMTPFTHLTKLRVYNCISSEKLYQFMRLNNLINESEIISLTCEYFMEYSYINNGAITLFSDFNGIDFYRFLACFTKLQQLQLIKIQTTWNHDHFHQIKRLFPKLKQISCRDSKEELCNAIINIFGQQLESLIMSRQSCDNIHCDQGFPNLIELSLTSPSLSTLNHILEKVTKLERFGISMNSSKKMSNSELNDLLIKLLKTQLKLTYFGFDINVTDFDEIMDGIIAALTFTHNIYRNELKIGFNVMECNQKMIKSANKWMTKIMEQFDRIEIENYMIEFNFFRINDNHDIDDRLNRIKMMKNLNKKWLAIFENISTERHRSYLRFVVSNKKCAINGYRADWSVYK